MDRKEKQKISSSVPKELIQVEPSELRFPFLPNAMLSVKLVNVTDNYVVFVPRFLNRNVAEYPTCPYGGILPPRSTHEFLVSREAKKSVAQSIECVDKYILLSTTLTEDLSLSQKKKKTEDLSKSEYCSDLDEFYDKQGGCQIWHRRDLAVVLYPAYQQESPDGMPHTGELIHVDPHELRFPFIPEGSISVTSLIKVANITDDYIAFLQRRTVTNVAKYTMTPSDGILPPRSTQDIVVRRTAKNGVLQSIECNDMNILFSTIVSEDFKTDDLPNFCRTQVGVIWHMLELGVLLEVDTQLQPSDTMPHTEMHLLDLIGPHGSK